MSRRAKPIPTEEENPLLIVLRTKTEITVPTWVKKF